MKISKLTINNFRGIKYAELFFDGHSALVGDNNSGKSTILEAIDLVLGPERLSRYPVLDEHDFIAGEYISNSESEEELFIQVEVIITDLNDEQLRYFRNHIEYWNFKSLQLLESPPPESTDSSEVKPALRIMFKGHYDSDDDDFKGKTFFCSPIRDDLTLDNFKSTDKRICGFLFLRTLRTGSRALSLEKGSLLDIIIRLKEIRPQMWEDILIQLREISVAQNPELGISEILTSVQEAIRNIVPSEWAENPKLKVSNMTRAHLRKILTVFMGTGILTKEKKEYAAPFTHQGTGTINTLVLALLSMIAELKQNVIFAMEEPEIAIPPYTQKRIINSVISKSAQAIFTSHSPYVLEEFKPSNILVIQRDVKGMLKAIPAVYPPSVKPKKYREEFRKRFCEALLSRRVLIFEGRTEFDAIPASARRLNEINTENYKPFEALGIAVINAETDSQIHLIGKFYQNLGKEVYAIFDKQTEENRKRIKANVDYPFEAQEKGFEDVILKGISESALRRYALSIVSEGLWPPHLNDKVPTKGTTKDDLIDVMKKFLKNSKGSGEAADLLVQCNESEFPNFIIDTVKSIKQFVENSLNSAENKMEDLSSTQTNSKLNI